MARRMSTSLKEYQFFRSFSAKIENWPLRKAEAIWRKMRERKIAEIEAIEACKWLRAAGFPQYAQMYEDFQFPIDLSNVGQDHPFLENDPLQSLYRRLEALNKSATMRLDSNHKPEQKEDSEEEEYALSENWTYEKSNRRWSRVGDLGLENPANLFVDKTFNTTASSRESSSERTDYISDKLGFNTLPHEKSFENDETNHGRSRLRRTGSERLKDGAKAFFRRVESIKTSRKKKKIYRDGVLVPGTEEDFTDFKTIIVPSQITNNNSNMKRNTKLLSEYEGSSHQNSPILKHYPLQKFNQVSQSTRTLPVHFFSHSKGRSSDFKSEDESSDATPELCSEIRQKRVSRAKRFLQKGSKVEDVGAVSDTECHQHTDFLKIKPQVITNTNANTNELKVPKLTRGGSLNLRKESHSLRDNLKSSSFRSRSTTRHNDQNRHVSKCAVGWHSFQNNDKQDFRFRKYFSSLPSEGIPIACMSCGQIQVLRKLALVTLTGYMERYCPSHRPGWNWELPKFIKKIKAPDYKDKKVFGVPFLLVLQRTGETLPKSIECAIKWLKLNAINQIGIFRKSGVKSRILRLKSIVEESPIATTELFDMQQTYDIADLVKQYFRELPDMLLTAKMSETFVAIFQYLPVEVQADAIQAAVLLLPDEHREVLQHLLEFLNKVADNSDHNQMTANNLAVCLAPSLFHGNTVSMSVHASPRHKVNPTGPYLREISETKASHDCLKYMIENHKAIFTISKDKIIRCNFGYLEESRPVSIKVLGADRHIEDWKEYVEECISATIKENKEKSRNWISISSADSNVEVAYKKLGDGHPLRLWRCTTIIDVSPKILLHYILKDRNHWDKYFIKWSVVQKLDESSEIIQYASGSQMIADFCVLRSWTTNLPKGTCVLIETSVDHLKSSVMSDSVRGIVLASRYLIETSGNGKSKLVHFSRVDIKGKTPEWYNKCYGHICSRHLSRIREYCVNQSIEKGKL